MPPVAAEVEVEAPCSIHDDRIGELERDGVRMTALLQGIVGAINRMEGAQGTIFTKLDGISSKVEEVRVSQAGHSARLEGLAERVSRLDQSPKEHSNSNWKLPNWKSVVAFIVVISVVAQGPAAVLALVRVFLSAAK